MFSAENRPTKMTVDLSAVVHNAKELIRYTNGANLIAVLKADGYGTGAAKIASVLEENKLAFKFAVSNLDEAFDLVNAGIKTPIWIFGAHDYRYLNQFIENEFELTVGSLDWLKNLPPLDGKLKIQLSIDTGMSRIGFTDKDEIKTALEIIESNSNLQLTGVYTHFATADAKDNSNFEMQVEKWHQLIDALDLNPELFSLANSAATIWHRDEIPTQNIRPGMALYGINPSDDVLQIPTDLNLKPALSIKSALTDIREVKKGVSVSYGATYAAQEDIFVGTIPIGYADGLNRRFQGYSVYIDGVKQEIIGRITMDYTLIKLDKNYPVDSEVEIFGIDSSFEKAANFIDTISYEIITNISDRVKREYDR